MEFACDDIPLYHGRIALVVTENPKDLLKKFTKESVESTDILNSRAVYAHTLYLNRNGRVHYTVVLNFNSKAGEITWGTIAHEAIHVCSFLYDCRGMEMDLKEDEPLAYLLEWVVDWLMKNIRKWKLDEKIKWVK